MHRSTSRSSTKGSRWVSPRGRCVRDCWAGMGQKQGVPTPCAIFRSSWACIACLHWVMIQGFGNRMGEQTKRFETGHETSSGPLGPLEAPQVITRLPRYTLGSNRAQATGEIGHNIWRALVELGGNVGGRVRVRIERLIVNKTRSPS